MKRIIILDVIVVCFDKRLYVDKLCRMLFNRVVEFKLLFGNVFGCRFFIFDYVFFIIKCVMLRIKCLRLVL